MKSSKLRNVAIAWLALVACNPQEEEQQQQPIGQLQQGLTERWGTACTDRLQAYAAVDRYSETCIASAVLFDKRIISPAGATLSGTVCVKIWDGATNPESCQSVTASTTTTSLPHRGYPCQVTASATIVGVGGGCDVSPATAAAFVSEVLR